MNKDNILILNFEAYKPPTFKEQKGKDYILYGAEKEWKNNYGSFLIDLYNSSSTHNAIINGKVRYIVGQGWQANRDLNLQDKMSVSKFINDVGTDSLKQLTEKIVKDKKIFGGFALQPIWSKDKKKIVELHHIPFQDIRVSSDGENYYYTSNWKEKTPEENEDYTVFNKFNYQYGTDQLIYFKEYRPGLEDYPLPDYVSVINYIASEKEIASFIASNTSSGFVGGTLINLFNGQPSIEAAREIERKFKNKFTGSENAGAILLNFSDPDKQGAEIVPLADNGQDERYTNLRRDVKEEIFTGHQFPISLLTKTETGLSNNADEIRTTAEQFQNVYISPEQDIIEELFNEILAINGLPKCLEIKRLEPVKAQLSETALMQISTNEELRRMAGLPQLKQEQQTSSVADVLGTLSPLVATKVLDNMTTEEIRNLVGLQGGMTRSTTNMSSQETCKHDFSDEHFFSAVSGLGYSDDEIEVISEKFIMYNPFTFSLTAVDRSILGLLLTNPSMTTQEIADATGLSVEEVTTRIANLKDENLLNKDNEVQEDELKPSDNVEELITVYKYVERPGVPNARSGSRDFCKRLMGVNRNFTREDIDRLRNEFGGDVWNNRGGWYHNPATDVTTPFCRHIWQSRVVKVKK